MGRRAYHTYVRPLRHRRRKEAYDAKAYYDARYAVAREAGEFTDATAMQPGHSPLRTRYHYNAVENAILEALIPSPAAGALLRPRRRLGGRPLGRVLPRRPRRRRRSWAWRSPPRPSRGSESASPAPEGVEFVDADVSTAGFSLERTFDVINVVGVLYHIVDDEAWRRAVANLGGHLAPGGALVVGEQFPAVSLDAGFHRSDHFSSWEEEQAARPERMLVGKRLRSQRAWRGAAAGAGLKVGASVPVRTSKSILTPVTRVLVFRRAG